MNKFILPILTAISTMTAVTAQTDWTGATDGNWDTTTDNWTGGTASLYTNGDDVEFGDTGGANTTISITSAVTPGSVTFTDTGVDTTAYVFNTSAINGTGAVTLGSGFGGSVQLNVSNGYSGGTIVNDGTLIIGNGGALGSGTLTLAGGVVKSNTTIINAINVTGTADIIGTGNSTYNSDITGSGTLNFGGSGNAQAAATVILKNGALDGFTGTIVHDNANNLNNLRIQNTTTAGKLQTTGDTTSNRFVGIEGSVEVSELSGDGGQLGTWTTGAVGGTLTVNQSSDTTYSGHLGAVTATGRNLNIVKSGSGSLTLDFENTYTGTTTLNAGTLVAGNDAAFSTSVVTLAGGTLTNTGARSISNAINITGIAQIDAANSANFTLSGPVTGAGTLNLGGVADRNSTLSISDDLSGFSGTANYTNHGTGNNVSFTSALDTTAKFTTSLTSTGRYLRFASGGTIGELSGDGQILINNGTTLTINQSTDSTFSGSTGGHSTGRGAFTKAGTGTLTLTGANQHTEATTVSGGTLIVDGSLAAASDVSVASGAAIGGNGTIGNLTLDSGADFVFSLTDTLDAVSTSFGGFGVANIVGLDNTVADGTYTLISGTIDWANVSNIGFGNAYDLGDGKLAYFQEGSLELVVVPEPGAYALLAGLLGLSYVMVRRRKV